MEAKDQLWAKEGGLRLTLLSAGNSETYEVLALYAKKKNRPLTVGKLRVVSYAV